MNHLKKYFQLLILSACACADPASSQEMIIRSPLSNLHLIATYAQNGEHVQAGQVVARLESKALREKRTMLSNKLNNFKEALKKVDRRLAQYTADLNQKKVDQANLTSQFVYAQQTTLDPANSTELKLALSANTPHLQNLKKLVADTQSLKDRLNENMVKTEVSLIQLEEHIQATEIKAPCSGVITSIASVRTLVPATGYPIATIKHI